ncbi:trk active potasium channel (plasmid) [Haloferax mediterranei ATCC 33500]|uniref:Potassium transporter n=1 Tax=Haloferax mediterranei (strain ATCC 33500 / DSM 1411 / JCM 8866 / NBRC 14739 / NCIMB 2177 / R-4) TaxID=523841 RepID=I3RA98_HALMT|nr:trk active potasium channel [Haloferax mediterranei ATCC 33500]AHZ24723.1 potassium transporter [Haloferax mediterranei ATCC 33500]
MTTIVLTLVYNVGMGIWEGRSQPLYRSLEVVFQSLTTTGYGEDAPWDSLQMNLLVIGIQLTGIGLILTAVDIFAVPWLQSALKPSAPSDAPDHSAHVVICGFTPRTEAFLEELATRERPYVLIESDEAVATDLHRADYDVVHGDPEVTEVLSAASVADAAAVVVDAPDDATASIVLSVREVNPEVRTVTLVEHRGLGEYLDVAGADAVLSPRQLLGESIASEVPTAVSTLVDEEVEIGEDLQLVEVGVTPDSDLCGRTVAEAQLRERFGVDMIGAWVDGSFESPFPPDTTIEGGVRLLVVGDRKEVDSFRDEAIASVQSVSSQTVVIAGYGESGRAAARAFEGTTTNVTVLDIEDDSQVDVVGDVRDPEVLERAGIGDASALVITVGDDTTAILATLIARDRNPDLRLLVRANEEDDVTKLYRAGADFVQSLATVSGRMIASTVFEDEEVFVYDKQVSVVRLPATDLAGKTVAEAAVRSRTGVTVIAVVREEEIITNFDPTAFEIAEGDDVIVAGADEHIRRFESEFGG